MAVLAAAEAATSPAKGEHADEQANEQAVALRAPDSTQPSRPRADVNPGHPSFIDGIVTMCGDDSTVSNTSSGPHSISTAWKSSAAVRVSRESLPNSRFSSTSRTPSRSATQSRKRGRRACDEIDNEGNERAVVENAETDAAPEAQFAAALAKAGNANEPDRRYRERCLRCCRAALAARIQLEILEEDLERVAETAADDADAGANKLAAGLLWAGRFLRRDAQLRLEGKRDLDTAERVALFKALEIGAEESPKDELSSRQTLDLGAQATAVGAAMLAGNRSGLPPSARAALATLRGITLASSSVVRLLARSPAVGAALIFLLSALLVWGIVSPGVLLGGLCTAIAASAPSAEPPC